MRVSLAGRPTDNKRMRRRLQIPLATAVGAAASVKVSAPYFENERRRDSRVPAIRLNIHVARKSVMFAAVRNMQRAAVVKSLAMAFVAVLHALA